MRLLISKCIRQGSNQRKRTSREHKLRDSLQGIGLRDCGGWLGESKITGQAASKGLAEGAVHKQNFFISKFSALFSRPFNWLNEAHPNYLESSPSLKVNWLWTLVTPTKYLNSNTYVSVWWNNWGCSLVKLT